MTEKCGVLPTPSENTVKIKLNYFFFLNISIDFKKLLQYYNLYAF